ncbi:hypothetical protein D3C81_1238080 [compost metagenome]
MEIECILLVQQVVYKLGGQQLHVYHIQPIVMDMDLLGQTHYLKTMQNSVLECV